MDYRYNIHDKYTKEHNKAKKNKILEINDNHIKLYKV